MEHTFVCTDVKFGDFILEADCKIDGDFNSGILFRAIDMPDVKLPKARLNGYQVKIDPTPRKWTGGVFEDYGGPSWQSYYNLADDARAREAFKIGEWNKFRVEAIGKSIKVWVNGVPTANLTHDKYSNGYIALKIHALGNKPEPEKVLGHFNNIRIITENSAAYAQPMSLPATTALETAAPKRQTEVSIRGEDFYINGQPTYKGRVWNAHRIEGLLLNSRMVQGIFDDLNPETTNRWAYPDTRKLDSNRNTSEFIAAMPLWRTNGLLAFTLNLQGGSPYGYSREQPWRNSAFAPDGSLRPEYFARLACILDRADELGMVVILGYFYQAQDRILTNETAVLSAVDNATVWVLDHGYRNVIVEINNECDQHYINEILQPLRVHELVARVRHTERNGFHLLASTSYSGPLPKENVVTNAGFILVHGNGLRQQPQRVTDSIEKIRAMLDHPKPIVFNEDDNYNFEQPMNNFVAAVGEHASWGYFDYRRKDENFNEGFQSAPGDWTIGSERKREFFRLVSEMTGESEWRK